MEVYNSEEEQIEALKAWWDKNGKSVLIAIAVVLLAVFGWQSWQKQKNAHAANASAALQEVLDTLQTKPDSALEGARQLSGEYPGSIYAAVSSLAAARAAVEKNDLDGAAAYLQAAMSASDQPELQQLAKLRLSRVLLAQGKADEAMAQLQDEDAGTLQAAYDEQRGDILLSQGKRDEARAAYINAMSGYREAPDKQRLLQLKLDDLAESSAK